MSVIIGVSLGKPDGDKLSYWIGRIIGTPCSRTVFIVFLSFVLAQWA